MPAVPGRVEVHLPQGIGNWGQCNELSVDRANRAVFAGGVSRRAICGGVRGPAWRFCGESGGFTAGVLSGILEVQRSPVAQW